MPEHETAIRACQAVERERRVPRGTACAADLRCTRPATNSPACSASTRTTCPDQLPRYNIAPTQLVAVVRLDDGQRVIKPLRWGLIPSWAKDARIGNSLINARAETIAEKPAFRSAFKKRRWPDSDHRLLRVGDHGHEEEATAAHPPDRRPAVRTGRFVGTLDRRRGRGGRELHDHHHDGQRPDGPFHDRMPVILAPVEHGTFLDPQTPADLLHKLLRPYPSEGMEASAGGGLRQQSSPRGAAGAAS